MNLPALLASFFHAFNAKDTETFLAHFAPDAIVTDEGHDYRGTVAIRGWFATINAKYQPTVEATGLAEVSGQIVVTTQVNGTFPGSPIQLHYHFILKDDKIATLSIVN